MHPKLLNPIDFDMRFSTCTFISTAPYKYIFTEPGYEIYSKHGRQSKENIRKGKRKHEFKKNTVSLL